MIPTAHAIHGSDPDLLVWVDSKGVATIELLTALPELDDDSSTDAWEAASSIEFS